MCPPPGTTVRGMPAEVLVTELAVKALDVAVGALIFLIIGAPCVLMEAHAARSEQVPHKAETCEGSGRSSHAPNSSAIWRAADAALVQAFTRPGKSVA